MSKKSQHNNILLAVIGFTAVVILVGVIGFFTLEQKDDTIQGEVEVSEYRVSCKLPGRIVELRVKEGDYVHVGDTLAILEVPEMKSQEQMLQATNAAAEAMKLRWSIDWSRLNRKRWARLRERILRVSR